MKFALYLVLSFCVTNGFAETFSDYGAINVGNIFFNSSSPCQYAMDDFRNDLGVSYFQRKLSTFKQAITNSRKSLEENQSLLFKKYPVEVNAFIEKTKTFTITLSRDELSEILPPVGTNILWEDFYLDYILYRKYLEAFNRIDELRIPYFQFVTNTANLSQLIQNLTNQNSKYLENLIAFVETESRIQQEVMKVWIEGLDLADFPGKSNNGSKAEHFDRHLHWLQTLSDHYIAYKYILIDATTSRSLSEILKHQRETLALFP